ncbi:MAG TPA: CHASE4 domain-containing protein [Myxococcota bacterium]|nr:CHASE4 domain-containing protein [Myxococcota bacterium]
MAARLPVLSLRWRAIGFLLVVSATFVAGSHLLQRAIVQPEFAALESRQADADLARAVEAIGRESQVLANTAQDYGAWDDTYRFVADENAEYVESNLVPETLANLGVDAMVIARSDGEVVWGRRLDDSGELVPDAELIAALVARANGLVGHAAATSKVHGVLATPAGLLLVGSAAITNSAQDAPVRGSVVFARPLDADEVAAIGERTRVALSISPFDAPRASAASADHAGSTPHGDVGDERHWHDPSSAAVLRSFAPLNDVNGKPALLVKTEMQREPTQRAAAAARLSMLCGVAGGLVMMLVMWWALARWLVRPLERVTAHAGRVGAEGGASASERLGLTTRDEIGILAREFDAMVERLERSRAELIAVAHQAGRAEVASAVLHDVGNVLNSVAVAASVANETLARSEVGSLRRATDLLEQHAGDVAAYLSQDAQGRHLVPFLAELATQLESEQHTLSRELKTLSAAVEHIAALVRAQNQNSSPQAVLEQLDPSVLIEQALQLCAQSFERHAISVQRQIESGPPVWLDRHRALQVLGNLLRNADHAIRETRRGSGTLRIALRRTREEAGGWIELAVGDDGIGIAQSELARIFARGYSTREGGQGIGLHYAANLAREMGGELRAESAGPGRGACFTLRIPAQQRTSG